MKKTFLILIIILIVVAGGLLLNSHTTDTLVVAPETAPAASVSSSPAAPSNISSTPTRVPGPEKGTVKIGESVALGPITIKVKSLGQDSRCPTQVTCIQAGSVTVSTTVSDGATSTDHTFITTAAPFVFEGYSIAITDVTPVPTTSTAAIKLSDYRIIFVATPTAKGDTL